VLAPDGADEVNRPRSKAEKVMQTEIIGSRPLAGSQSSSGVGTLLAAIFAAFLGGILLWGVGFSHIEVLHNAAHDTRHSAGFPCH
jgi:cobalt transporter subunit CbtB